MFTCIFSFSWNQSRQWWVREFQSDYLFPLTWDNPGLHDYLQKANFLPEVRLFISLACSKCNSCILDYTTYYMDYMTQNYWRLEGCLCHLIFYYICVNMKNITYPLRNVSVSLQANGTSYKPHTLMNLLSYTRQLSDECKPLWIIWAMFISGILGTMIGYVIITTWNRCDYKIANDFSTEVGDDVWMNLIIVTALK